MRHTLLLTLLLAAAQPLAAQSPDLDKAFERIRFFIEPATIATYRSSTSDSPIKTCTEYFEFSVPADLREAFLSQVKVFRLSQKDNAGLAYHAMGLSATQTLKWSNGELNFKTGKLEAGPADDDPFAPGVPQYFLCATFPDRNQPEVRHLYAVHYWDDAATGGIYGRLYRTTSEISDAALWKEQPLFPEGIEAQNIASLVFIVKHDKAMQESLKRHNEEIAQWRQGVRSGTTAQGPDDVFRTFDALDSRICNVKETAQDKREAALSIYLLLKKAAPQLTQPEVNFFLGRLKSLQNTLTALPKSDEGDIATAISYLVLSHNLLAQNVGR